MKIGQYCQRQRCRHAELKQFRQAVVSRGFVSDSWAFLLYRCHETTGETRMCLAITGRKRQTVQTARRLAVFQKWRLQQGMSDGRLLTDDTAGCAAAA